MPDPIQDPIHDVAIVGFGPVGQTSALLLGRLGYDVVVLERWPQPYALPRAVHFDHEIGRIFQAAGVADEVAAITDPVPDSYEWHAADGRVLLKIDWSGLGPSGWPTANFFSQPQLEQVLATAVAALANVTVLRGHKVLQLREDDDHVTLTATSNVRKQHTVRARYVIGADGANSFVRRHTSTSVTDRGFFFDWLIVDTIPHDEREWSPMNWQLCDPARPTTIVSGGPGRRRWEFLRLADETIESLNTLDTAWRLLDPWGRTPANTTIERHAVYTFQARWADRWHQGRLLLAGDAAHLMPPFAGQGMCSGLRDAVNLAWKLDLVLRGRAHEQLLDTYTTERSAHVQHAIQMSVSLGEVICVLDPDLAEHRNQRMVAAGADPARALPPMPPSSLVDGAVHRGPDGKPDGLAGTLSPQFRICRDGHTGRFDDVVGNGFALITAGQDPADALSSTDLDLVTSLGQVVRLAPAGTTGAGPDAAIDVDNAYLPHLADARVAAVIVRPDFYVYGGVTDLADLPRLVAALRNDLTLVQIPT